MKLISVLGTGNYGECKYKWNDKVTSSCIFIQTALNELVKFDNVLIFLTKEAKEKNFGKLEEEFKNKKIKINLEGIDIPAGKNEKELWEIFETIEKKINKEEEIWFDITHSFRSIPVIFFLVLAYLRKVKNIKLRGLTYGAYEARKGDVAPVINLTPFVDLLDWIIASDRFLNSGDATKIRDMLREIQAEYYRKNAKEKPKKLQNFGKHLDEFQEAIHLTRIENALTLGNRLKNDFKQSIDDISKFAPPVKLLLEEIEKRVETVSSKEVFDNNGMKAQLNLLNVYLKTHKYVQCVSLAREWIVSLVCIRNGWEPINERSRAEIFLNAVYEALKRPNPEIIPKPEMVEIYKIWGELRDIRNDIDHCGMKKQPMPTETLKNNIVGIVDKLSETVEKKNLLK